jgi:orotidine-5'-phosphate decarboxylase
MPKINDLRDRMIVALDVPTVREAYHLITELGDAASFYKIGYRLAFAGGLTLADELLREDKKVFLDLKLHDIGNTVEEGVQSLTRMNLTFLTVHAYPQTMRGAVEGRGDHPMGLLAVTALTSYDDADLHVVLEAVAAEPHLYLTSGQTCRNVEALQAYLGLDEGDE